MENKTLRNKLARYIDAGFPILYINTFEEGKVDEIIASISYRKEVCEWNGTNGFVDFDTKAPLWMEGYTLEMTLDEFKTKKILIRKLYF